VVSLTLHNINTILGKGLITPLRRQGSDFAFGEGKNVLYSAIRQILMTRRGELRWRPDFGLNIEKARHKGITDTLLIEIQADVGNALAVEPRIEVTSLDVKRLNPPSTKIIVTVKWRAITKGSRQSTVLTDVETTEVVI